MSSDDERRDWNGRGIEPPMPLTEAEWAAHVRDTSDAELLELRGSRDWDEWAKDELDRRGAL